MADNLTIRTNNVPRDVLTWHELKPKERAEFDYLTPELWLCDDCTIAAVNDDYSGMDDERAAEVGEAIERMGYVACNSDSETGEGTDEFSSKACDCCESPLHGSRTRFCDFKPAEEASFIRYKGVTYHLGDFMSWDSGVTPQMEEAGFRKWAGYQGDSFFSGVLVRYVGRDLERVVMGTYYS